MFMEAFRSAWGVITRKPLVLWGLSLLSVFITSIASIFTIGIPALGIAITFLISCGMAKVYLDGLDGKEVYADQMFAGFSKNCFRIAGGMAWQTLWIVLWALIPIVGPIIAIVKAYSYRFVPYILISKPEVTATQALKLSMKETKGLKGQMFLADLCFVASVFVICLGLALLSAIPVLGVLFALIYAIVLILIIAFSSIFVGLYQAYFYAYGKDYYNQRYQQQQQQYAYQNQYANNGYGYGQNPNPYGNGQGVNPNGFGYGQDVNNQQNGAYNYGQQPFGNNQNMYGQNVNPNNGYPQGNGFDQNNQYGNGQNNNYNGY